MLTPTAATGHPAAVARPQRGVAAHTWCQQGQRHKCRPTQAKTLVTGVTRARVREVAFGVRHAVVEQAVGTPHEADPPDAGLNGVRRLLAATPAVLLLVKQILAVDAA